MKVKLNFNTDKPTINGRIYPKEVLREALLNFQYNVIAPIMNSNTYTNVIDISKVSGVVKDFTIDEYGEVTLDIKILETNHGKLLQQLIDNGYRLTPMMIVNDKDIKKNIIKKIEQISYLFVVKNDLY